MKDRFDQHLPRGNKVRGAKPTKKLGIIMVGLFCLFVGCHGQQSVMKLTPGTKLLIVSIPRKENRVFKIAVPPSNIVTCHTDGTSRDSGDADLYAKFGSEPNIYSELFSEGLFANETVGPLEASKTSARRLYVMVYAYTALKNVELWCDLNQEPSINRNPSENPTRRPTLKPTRKPTHKPTSKPTICFAPGVEVACPVGTSVEKLNPLCCDKHCTNRGVHRCCLRLGNTCTENSSCCSGHCVCDGESYICRSNPAPATDAQLSIQEK